MKQDQISKEISSGKLFMIGNFKFAEPVSERHGTNAKGPWSIISRKIVVEQEATGRTVDVELSDDAAREFKEPAKGTRVLCQIHHAASGKYGYEVKARSINAIEG